MDKLDMKTVNFTDENIAKIAEIFPNVVSEDANGKVYNLTFAPKPKHFLSHILQHTDNRG